MTDARSDGPSKLVTPQFLIFVIAEFCYFGAFGMTVPVLPELIRDDLGGSSFSVGVIVGIMALSSLLIRPWITPRVVTWRASRIVFVSAVVGGLSFALYALPDDIYLLGIARLVTGAAQACLLVTVISFITGQASDENRGRAASYVSIGPYLGLGVGPVIGQPIASHLGNEAVFMAAAAITVVGAIPVLFVRSPAGASRDTKAPRFHRGALLPGFVLALGAVGAVTMSAFMPLFAGDTLDIPPAYVFLTYSAVILATRILGGGLPDRFGVATLGPIATLLIITGLLGIAAAPNAIVLYVFLVPFGMGMALQYPALMLLAMRDVTAVQRPAAIATYTMFLDVANGLGGFVAGLFAALGGYRAAFAGSAGASAIGLVLLIVLVVRPHRRGRVSVDAG